VPALSVQIDPNNFIRDGQCGVMADGDMERLSTGLKRLMDGGEFYRTCSRNIRDYVWENHELEGRVRELESALEQLLTVEEIQSLDCGSRP